MMDRRKFLGLFGAGVAGIALEQAIPLGRVWSFPKKIVAAPANELLTTDFICDETLRMMRNNFYFTWHEYELFIKNFAVGETLTVKFPQRFTTPALRPVHPSSS